MTLVTYGLTRVCCPVWSQKKAIGHVGVQFSGLTVAVQFSGLTVAGCWQDFVLSDKE